MVRQRQRNKDGEPIRSVFYLRMSTDKQDLSIGGQRYHLLQFVESDESNDRVVVGEYIDEGITGSTASRANFQRMMADATGPNPPFDEVITYDLSRFSRDTVDSLTYPRILQAHGIGFHSFKDNFSSDASGRLHMTLIAGVNEFHNYKTAEGSSRGQADATRMGYYTAPRAPFGFLKERVTVGGNEHSILVIDPEKAPLVQRIFGMVLQGHTPLDIAKTLNAEGIPSSTGNTWSADVITPMLHNVRYAGTGCHGKRSHSKFLFNSTVTLVPNAHPAIVSQETFDKVQEILTSRRFIPSDPESKHPRRAASPFLLSNLVYCKCCEKKMFVRNSGKDRRKLACSTNRSRGAGACPTRPEDMEVVETTVLRALLKKVLTEKNLRQVVQKVGEDSKNFAERQDRECETIIVKLEDIKTQKNNIIQAIAREGRHIPDLATYLDGLSQEQAGLEARKVGLDTERNELQAFLSDELRIIENASRVRTYLQSEERSVVMSMIESFVKKVELNNGSVTIHYSIPMPPGGNGKKVGSETLPLNGDQWPMETPAPAGAAADGGRGRANSVGCNSPPSRCPGFPPVLSLRPSLRLLRPESSLSFPEIGPWNWSVVFVLSLSRPQPVACRRAGSGFSSVFRTFFLSMRGISCPELLLIGYCLPNLLLTFIHIRGLFGPIACFFVLETVFVICVVSLWCVVISEPGEFRVVHAPHDYVLGHRLGVLAGGPIAAAQELRFGGAVCPGGQGLSALRAVLGRGPRLYRFHLFLFPFRVSVGARVGISPSSGVWVWSSL